MFGVPSLLEGANLELLLYGVYLYITHFEVFIQKLAIIFKVCSS